MAQVYVNPYHLEEFANKLLAFGKEVSAALQMLEGKLKALGDTWRDQEYEKFVQNFNESRNVLVELLREIDDVHPKLMQDVATILEYLLR